MVYVEHTCLWPFHNVMLVCDKCGKCTARGNHDHVVEVEVRETGAKGTICKRCFQEMAAAQELVSKQ